MRFSGNTDDRDCDPGLQFLGAMSAPQRAVAVGTMQDPTPKDLADAWHQLTGSKIDPDLLASLVAAIRAWPTGRLATGARPIIVSWQRVAGSVYVTIR